MQPPVNPIRELSLQDDDAIRREVLSSGRPAVLRGLVRDWPIVNVSTRSPAERRRVSGPL
jgi:hypothetical protein